MANPDRYEIRIGVEDKHWFVGVRPTIPQEVMSKLGGEVMKGWAVEQFEPTTVFRKHTKASEEATREAVNGSNTESGLAFALVREGATVHVIDWAPVEMYRVTSPFDVERASERPSPLALDAQASVIGLQQNGAVTK